MSCLAIADGAGSRTRSELGSAHAVHEAIRRANHGPIEVDDLDGWLRDTFYSVRARLTALADAAGAHPNDYATTLAVALLIRDQLAVGQIGDTIVVVGGMDGYETLSPPGRFEYANETVFITETDINAHIRIDVCDLKRVDQVVLSTDGMRFQILDNVRTFAPYRPFFEDVGVYARLPDVDSEAVGTFLSTTMDQSADDKTLVIAVRQA